MSAPSMSEIDDLLGIKEEDIKSEDGEDEFKKPKTENDNKSLCNSPFDDNAPTPKKSR
jgi:hypothetical protein